MNSKEELLKRLNGWKVHLGDLSYQRVQIDKDMASLEGAIRAAESVLSDMNTEEAIKQAQTQTKEEIKNV